MVLSVASQGDLFAEESYVGRAKDKKPDNGAGKGKGKGASTEPGANINLEYRYPIC